MKTDYGYTALNSIASITIRYGRFGIDMSKIESHKKILVSAYDEEQKRLVPFCELPVIKSRNEIIRVLNLLCAYTKARAAFDDIKLNPATLTVPHDTFVKLLSKMAPPAKVAGRKALWEGNN